MSLRFILKKKNGITLIEVLLYVTLLCIVLPMISTMLMHGFDAYKSNYRYIEQQDIVTNAIQLMRKDIESAKTIVFGSSNKEITLKFFNKGDRTWKFDSNDNTLKVNGTVVVKNIDVSKSSFEKQYDISDLEKGYDQINIQDVNILKKGYVILTIKPIETNDKKFQNRNFTDSIITELSVRYKEIQLNS